MTLLPFIKREINMKKKFYIERIESDIIEVSFEHGELVSTGCGLRELIGEGVQTFEDMLKHLNKRYNLSADQNDYEIMEEDGLLQTSKQVANHSEAQNGGWMEPTAKEIEDWKEGLGKLYSENYRIRFHKIDS
jgi:hypothetical protein